VGWHTRLVSETESIPGPTGAAESTVSARPRKARLVCGVAAALFFGVFAFVATALRSPVPTDGQYDGPQTFGASDQVAMVVLGALGAAAILALTRPRVSADAAGIRVRNLVGGYELPWSMIRAVRFRHGAPWASVELHDDDLLPVMAIQAADKQYAVEAVRQLRRLHAAAAELGK